MDNIKVIDELQISGARTWKGPRNLPKKTPKAYRRWRQKQAGKRNRRHG